MTSQPLTPEEFDAHLANRTLRLSFVGMSSCGKSYRSKMLAKKCDFFLYQVDGDIQKSLRLSGQETVSAWLGYPTSATYMEHERKYIELENEFTGRAAMQSPGKNFVFDTTGSVIHLDKTVLELMRENTLVVHLDVGEESIEALMDQFFKMPKPVAWSGYFNQNEGESEESSLRRCYPILLTERLKRYRTLANININSRELYDMSGNETLEIIRSKLKKDMI